jgi:hypothetical protein
MKALCYKAGFVSFNGAIGMPFYAEDPFTPNLILRGIGWNKGPSMVFEESIKLTIHCLEPLGILGGGGEASGFGETRNFSGSS